jgi:hypothetical protein
VSKRRRGEAQGVVGDGGVTRVDILKLQRALRWHPPDEGELRAERRRARAARTQKRLDVEVEVETRRYEGRSEVERQEGGAR